MTNCLTKADLREVLAEHRAKLAQQRPKPTMEQIEEDRLRYMERHFVAPRCWPI